MPLILHNVQVWNDSNDAYRLVIMDGDKIVHQTNRILPNQRGSAPALTLPINGELRLIAERE